MASTNTEDGVCTTYIRILSDYGRVCMLYVHVVSGRDPRARTRREVQGRAESEPDTQKETERDREGGETAFSGVVTGGAKCLEPGEAWETRGGLGMPGNAGGKIFQQTRSHIILVLYPILYPIPSSVFPLPSNLFPPPGERPPRHLITSQIFM
ncbi:hypothetical protein SODALDRAFT_183422 [Sodiomyces alkalinus F11]|uniref:Uncharacterized protein n=1 Tax=Sodiomyces alkalinus (strain CBS 110278 / VKM F-3762 / F11) TaxID=1314773 RepID=A0A3N2PUJ8_SODAK|nr:hypothetical protein SODALDRAFT_183422 [Sodiomyces alkalinus F11]ROT38185.1 hypothetical protein SODALDRAFT_183422 [Sodiomyces alkalinus F11]